MLKLILLGISLMNLAPITEQQEMVKCWFEEFERIVCEDEPRDYDCYPCLHGCYELSGEIICNPPPDPEHPPRGGGHFTLKKPKPEP